MMLNNNKARVQPLSKYSISKYSTLNQELNALKATLGENYFTNLVSTDLYNNLRADWEIRPYQQEALGRFIHYWQNYRTDAPTHILYHKATGSGKTLVMAGLILYLYQQGYRHFLFFVNSTNIIRKTKANFLHPQSSKYLFAKNITLHHRQVQVKAVDNFQSINNIDIHIVFQTIQGLHLALNHPKENSLTYEDFENQPIVLISDEAHHINAMTKKSRKMSKANLAKLDSWEHTVQRIFATHPKNILLEFTATVDLSHPKIAEKYRDKLIFDYPLKQFRDDGYSKEVKTLQSDLNELDRALQAIILSQYRKKLFEKNGILIKPVILFKSKTIKASQLFYEKFSQFINDLNTANLQHIQKINTNNIIHQAFHFFENYHIQLNNLILELKADFAVTKCLVINSQQDSERLQLAVNTLEDENNPYRVIFAVDKLNEGWDVLNLFDIVRLYSVRSNTKKTTLSEAQLIGRGARYCPFKLHTKQSLYQRKYDNSPNHELKICETLYYHAAYHPQYIQNLNTALIAIGIKTQTSTAIELTLKKDFLKSKFYQTALFFTNQQIKQNPQKQAGFSPSILKSVYSLNVPMDSTETTTLFENSISPQTNLIKKRIALASFGKTIIRKALNQFEFYKFNNLQKYFPHLQSISEFINAPSYLRGLKIEFTGNENELNTLSNTIQLKLSIQFLKILQTKIIKNHLQCKGSPSFNFFGLKDKLTHNTIQPQPTSNSKLMDATQQKWLVFESFYTTSRGQKIIDYFDKYYTELSRKYSSIYLIINNNCFEFYGFEDGKKITPEYVLYLAKDNQCHQVFIELDKFVLLNEKRLDRRFLFENDMKLVWKYESHFVWLLR